MANPALRPLPFGFCHSLGLLSLSIDRWHFNTLGWTAFNIAAVSTGTEKALPWRDCQRQWRILGPWEWGPGEVLRGPQHWNLDPQSTISWVDGCALCKSHPQQAFRLTWGRMRLLCWFGLLVGWLAGHGDSVYVLMEKPKVQHWPDWTWKLQLPNCPSLQLDSVGK